MDGLRKAIEIERVLGAAAGLVLRVAGALALSPPAGAARHGCIRPHNADVTRLRSRMPVGTPVTILP